MKQTINKPLYPFLLVIFFFLHALLENYNPVLIKTAGWLIIIYSVVAIVLIVLFKFLLKDWRKAALPAFSILAFNFFFGIASDLLKRNFHDAFITRLSFILSITLILLIVLFIYLKRTKRKLFRTTQYLNLLFILLILFDTASILLIKKKEHVADLSKTLTNCDTCSRPDIYLLIVDEYAGNTELKDLFSFDNSSFENKLKERGFHIINNSTSNYNATVYSMASMLNMNYISNLDKPSIVNHKDMLQCRGLINNNNFVNFLKKNGYTIYNHSFFDMAGNKKMVGNYFFPSYRVLLTGQTFIRRFIRNAGARFVSQKEITGIRMRSMYNDDRIYKSTSHIAMLPVSEPKFVYTHLNMPHHPYYYDSTGREIPVEKLTNAFSMDKDAYISYLKYTNRLILDLVDRCQKDKKKQPVIIIMGDHGFRQLTNDADRKYHFMNLDAVYFPNGNHNNFYDGMSAVNQFRVTLNTLFQQKLPLLKDSTHFLTE